MFFYRTCRFNPKLYRLIVKLGKIYYWMMGAYTIPAGIFMRRRYSALIENLHAPIVYLDKGEQDYETVQSILVTSFKILGEKAPTWRKHAGQLFKSFVITNTSNVKIVGACPLQQCCYFNPWMLVQLKRQEMKDPAIPIDLASWIVFSTSMTLLWERYAQCMSNRDRTILANKARARFLLRCLDIPRDGGTLAKIKDAKTQSDFMDVGITPEDVKANPSIFSIIAGIQTIEQRVAKARAARKNKFDRESYFRVRFDFL